MLHTRHESLLLPQTRTAWCARCATEIITSRSPATMSSSSAAPRPRAIPTLRQRKHATTTVATHDDDDARGQHEIPLPDRAPFSRWRTFAITFAFFAFLFPIHCAQLFFYPMSYVPGGIRELYWVGVRSSLNTFARCIVWISGQTTLVITADDSVDLDTVVKKDKDSGKLMLNLASHAGQ